MSSSRIVAFDRPNAHHHERSHGVEKDAIQEGVHYKHLGLYEPRVALQMVEEGGEVTFKKA